VLQCRQVIGQKDLNVCALDTDRRCEGTLVDNRPQIDRAEQIRIHGDMHFCPARALIELACLHRGAE
jgi:hypothetical protein